MLRSLFGRRLISFIFTLLPLATLLPFAATAQENQFEGQRIVAIQFEPVQQPLDPRDLEAKQKLKPGDTLKAEDVGNAIDALYASGRYTGIRVEAEPAPGGVIVRFVTVQQWFIGHVGAQGSLSQPPNRGQITNGTLLTLGQPFEETSLTGAESHIQDLLHANGFFESNVHSTVDRNPNVNQVNITFVLHTGKRAKYERPIVKGNTILSDDTIVGATGWRIRFIHWYKKVTASRTRDAVPGILKKYEKQNRLMATAAVTDLQYDSTNRRAKGTLEVEAGPKVDVRALEAKVSKGALKKYIPVFEERRVDRDLLVEGARNLRDYFQNQGYFDVNVNFRQRQEGPDQVVIEYVISKGQRFKLVDVQLTGNNYFTAETLRERMFLEPAGFLRFRHGRYSEGMRSKDEENIANLYKSNGFRDVKVTSDLIRNYKGKDGDIAVTMHIDEGEQWYVDNVALNGVQHLDKEYLRSFLSSLPGQPYSEYNVAVDRGAILTRYYSAGFPNAGFRWRAIPSATTPHHVNLEYRVFEHEQKYVRDILVSGVTTTRPNIIQNNMTLKPGDPLSLSAMTQAQQNLYNLGVFAKVDTAIQNPDGDTQYKYVLYDIEEAKRYSVNIGFGAEVGQIGGTTQSVSSPVGGNGFSPRVSLDLSRLNFLGRGHVVTLRGRVSRYDKRGSFNYIAPRFRNVEGRNITFTALYEVSQNIGRSRHAVRKLRCRSRSNSRVPPQAYSV